jgi:hypothetical protein
MQTANFDAVKHLLSVTDGPHLAVTGLGGRLQQREGVVDCSSSGKATAISSFLPQCCHLYIRPALPAGRGRR